MSTSTSGPSPNAPPEKSTAVVPVEEEETDEVENDNVENDNVENDDVEKDDVENDDVENDDVENDDVENADGENADMENADVENADVENDDDVIVEDFVEAHTTPGKAFMPMKREVDEDRDLEELCLLISSKKELVAKLRDRPEMFLKAKFQIIGGTFR